MSNAIQSGKLDNVLLELRNEIDARMASPDFKGRRPITAAERGPSSHCRGKASHPAHYYTNPNSRYNDLTWCIGTA